MSDLAELTERFSVPGVLSFDATPTGLVLLNISAPAAAATIYLQGAHLTHWQPAGQQPVLFLSPRTELAPGKAIRGGIPVIFPWFGPRQSDPKHDAKPSPAHGFARTSVWELAFAALAGDDLHLTFTLAPNQTSRTLGFDHFRLAYRITIGRRLKLEIMVANDLGAAESSGAPLVFEEALHTYFAVGDVEKATLTGLAGAAYLDKRDQMQRKLQPNGPMLLTGTTDRVYLDTTTTCTIADPTANRTIIVEKSGSRSTVVWNPWADLAATMPDMEPGGWRTMLCVETANVGESAITLQPGETHTMRAEISVEAIA
jgi:glucose-6-phosphate 1-epimerase